MSLLSINLAKNNAFTRAQLKIWILIHLLNSWGTKASLYR